LFFFSYFLDSGVWLNSFISLRKKSLDHYLLRIFRREVSKKIKKICAKPSGPGFWDSPFLLVTPVLFESPDIFVTQSTAIYKFAGGTF